MQVEQILEVLPNLPQSKRLSAFVAELSNDPQVVAVWLGGSMARGTADTYSDVDLRVAVQPVAYEADRIPDGAAGLVAASVIRFEFHFSKQTTLWHMLLDDGAIYDLHVQPADVDPPVEPRFVLYSKDDELASKLIDKEDVHPFDLPPANPDDIERAVQYFWMNQQKHLKVLYRGLPLLALQGEWQMRQDLIRFHYVLATGLDCGPLNRMTIHSLTPVIQAAQEQAGEAVLALVGGPSRTTAELIETMARLRDEVARVSCLLAAQLGFAYPEAAEATVRRSWAAFLAQSAD